MDMFIEDMESRGARRHVSCDHVVEKKIYKLIIFIFKKNLFFFKYKFLHKKNTQRSLS